MGCDSITPASATTSDLFSSPHGIRDTTNDREGGCYKPFFLHALVGVDLARIAQDLRIWMTPEFGLFELADEHAGGSSALPHARVPFGLQAVIGTSMMASTRLAGEMTSASGPSEGSEPLYASASLYQGAEDLIAATRYMADVVAKGRFNVEEMRRNMEGYLKSMVIS